MRPANLVNCGWGRLRRRNGMRLFDLPRKTQNDARKDREAAEKLSPMRLFTEPNCGNPHAEDGLAENGQRRDAYG